MSSSSAKKQKMIQKQKEQPNMLDAIIDGIVNEYLAYTRELNNLKSSYNYERINDQLVGKNQDLQNIENHIKDEKNKIENKIYNLIEIFSEGCQYARGVFSENLDKQLAIYTDNLGKLIKQAYEGQRVHEISQVPDCSSKDLVINHSGGNLQVAQELLEKIFSAKREVEKLKRISWVDFKVAAKIRKMNVQKFSILNDVSWIDSESNLRMYLDKFFSQLRIKELKTYDSYQNSKFF